MTRLAFTLFTSMLYRVRKYMSQQRVGVCLHILCACRLSLGLAVRVAEFDPLCCLLCETLACCRCSAPCF